MKKDIVPIFFTVDDGYVPFLSVALNSAIQNADADRQYKAIILHQELSVENQQRLAALATNNFEIAFVSMGKGLESITDRMSNRLRCDYFTLTIYFRLFIPTMFPEYDKGIYIDSDVVLLGDVAELYDTEIGDNYIGACTDLSVAEVPPLVDYMENAVGVQKDKYINSGVLLMNMKKLRQVNIEEHFLKLLTTYHFDCIAPDQDYINAMCCGKIYYLDTVWDVMPEDSKPENKDAKLIHYNLFSKPWCYDGIQYSDKFWKYAQDSGYLKEITDYKTSYSDEQKASDSKCMQLLLERGASIVLQDVTFKKMFENGVKIRL